MPSHNNTTAASSSSTTTPPKFLMPFALGVPSRRHRVLIRRVNLHMRGVCMELESALESERGVPTRSQVDTIIRKMLSARATMHELGTSFRQEVLDQISDEIELATKAFEYADEKIHLLCD